MTMWMTIANVNDVKTMTMISFFQATTNLIPGRGGVGDFYDDDNDEDDDDDNVGDHRR